ncbi:hypothetical protein MKK70_09975 [Methylobacterium sp. E-041]|uniref:hypothetical protein n=1 Tax=Methylobacterium sp. E-041 TaxID=2836573 RepID=UPI001FBA9386|nr:hypothetical protein [Methylobacterium sp. E-041]MCJ2105694.1 hypothetical protein [Methylobacterium sp. E-041]
MKAGATSASHELDHRITADLAGQEGSGIRRGRRTKPCGYHSGYSQHLHARHDLNLVSARHRFQAAGETEGCTSVAEPMLTRCQAIRSATAFIPQAAPHSLSLAAAKANEILALLDGTGFVVRKVCR